jgi:hypothetical protein
MARIGPHLIAADQVEPPAYAPLLRAHGPAPGAAREQALQNDLGPLERPLVGIAAPLTL